MEPNNLWWWGCRPRWVLWWAPSFLCLVERPTMPGVPGVPASAAPQRAFSIWQGLQTSASSGSNFNLAHLNYRIFYACRKLQNVSSVQPDGVKASGENKPHPGICVNHSPLIFLTGFQPLDVWFSLLHLVLSCRLQQVEAHETRLCVAPHLALLQWG